VESINKLHLGIILQKMIFDQGSLFFGDGLADLDRYEEHSIIVLEEELNYIGKAFRVSKQFRIELHTKIDPQLAIIKANRSILRTLIVNMINIAKKNIAADIFNNASNRKVFHEITIIAKLSSSNENIHEKQPSQVMELIVLDTGCPSKSENNCFSSFSKMMCRELSKQVLGEYQTALINHIDIKNVQKCNLPYESVERPDKIFLSSISDVINTNKIFTRTIQMIKSINNNEFKVLIFETDKFMLNQVRSQIEIYGWQTYLINSLEELLNFKELNSVGLVVIDDNANRSIISSGKVDIAKCVRFMGHPFAIVSLTSTLGQKPSSPFFTDSLAKPIVDTSIVKLKNLALGVFYEIVLSLEKKI
jgi:precorrin-6B methylase 1